MGQECKPFFLKKIFLWKTDNLPRNTFRILYIFINMPVSCMQRSFYTDIFLYTTFQKEKRSEIRNASKAANGTRTAI